MERLAVVLAGGASSRLGGGDKPLLDLGGLTLLDAVIDRLRPQADRIALSANGDPARFARFGLPVIGDGREALDGPLAGILAAMRWAAALGAQTVLTVPGDAPFLPMDLRLRLEAGAPDTGTILLASSTGRIHPVAALWPVALAGDLGDFLDGGGRKVMAFVEANPHATVDFGAAPPDPFFNVNTPDDLAEARRLLAEGRG